MSPSPNTVDGLYTIGIVSLDSPYLPSLDMKPYTEYPGVITG